MRAGPRHIAQAAARDAEKFTVQAHVFPRHGSFAISLRAGTACGHFFADPKRLVGGVARELHIGQAHAADKNLIRANGIRGGKSYDSAGGDKIVLVNAVAADTESSNELTVNEDAGAAWEENDATLIARTRGGRVSLKSLRAGIVEVIRKKIEERAGSKKL